MCNGPLPNGQSYRAHPRIYPSRRSEPSRQGHPPLPKRVRFPLDPTTSHHHHLAGALGGGFVPFWRQAELEHGPPRFIRRGPQPSSVRLDD
jgi:hypothetical protein